MNSILNAMQFFPSMVYTSKRPDLLDISREVSSEYIQKISENKDLNEIYPSYQSPEMKYDKRMEELVSFISLSSWQILQDQGHAMSKFDTFCLSMWCQEHHKHSMMEQHIHSGPQIVGFYFIDVPQNSSRLVLHDPRAGKMQINIMEENKTRSTNASHHMMFTPSEGDIVFTNSWLPHSFTRNSSENPIKFLHFNIGVKRRIFHDAPTAIVI